MVQDEEGNALIALVQDGIAALHHVNVGVMDAGLVEVIADGLHEGMKVVTEGAYGLPDGTKVHSQEQ